MRFSLDQKKLLKTDLPLNRQKMMIIDSLWTRLISKIWVPANGDLDVQVRYIAYTGFMDWAKHNLDTLYASYSMIIIKHVPRMLHERGLLAEIAFQCLESVISSEHRHSIQIELFGLVKRRLLETLDSDLTKLALMSCNIIYSLSEFIDIRFTQDQWDQMASHCYDVIPEIAAGVAKIIASTRFRMADPAEDIKSLVMLQKFKGKGPGKCLIDCFYDLLKSQVGPEDWIDYVSRIDGPAEAFELCSLWLTKACERRGVSETEANNDMDIDLVDTMGTLSFNDHDVETQISLIEKVSLLGYPKWPVVNSALSLFNQEIPKEILRKVVGTMFKIPFDTNNRNESVADTCETVLKLKAKHHDYGERIDELCSESVNEVIDVYLSSCDDNRFASLEHAEAYKDLRRYVQSLSIFRDDTFRRKLVELLEEIESNNLECSPIIEAEIMELLNDLLINYMNNLKKCNENTDEIRSWTHLCLISSRDLKPFIVVNIVSDEHVRLQFTAFKVLKTLITNFGPQVKRLKDKKFHSLSNICSDYDCKQFVGFFVEALYCVNCPEKLDNGFEEVNNPSIELICCKTVRIFCIVLAAGYLKGNVVDALVILLDVMDVDLDMSDFHSFFIRKAINQICSAEARMESLAWSVFKKSLDHYRTSGDVSFAEKFLLIIFSRGDNESDTEYKNIDELQHYVCDFIIDHSLRNDIDVKLIQSLSALSLDANRLGVIVKAVREHPRCQSLPLPSLEVFEETFRNLMTSITK